MLTGYNHQTDQTIASVIVINQDLFSISIIFELKNVAMETPCVKKEVVVMRQMVRKAMIVYTGLALVILGLKVAYAGDNRGMGGWEFDSPYNKLYNTSEMDSFKARVVKITEVVPMPGMSPGVAIYVKESDNGEVIEVQVCPTWYIKPGSIGLKRGDRVKVRGVWAEIDGKDVFIASKIKKGGYFVLKVRFTKDGKPFWALSHEELIQEKSAVGSK